MILPSGGDFQGIHLIAIPVIRSNSALSNEHSIYMLEENVKVTEFVAFSC